MKGISFTAKGTAEFVEEETPTCEPGTALMRTLYSGLSNGTERNKLTGGNYHSGTYPDRIGYQHVSEVVEVGSGFTRFQPADIVFSAMFPGHGPFHLLREGDLAVRLAPAGRTEEPDPEWLQAACLMGVASVSMHDARLARVSGGDRVLVFGAGLIGLFAVQAAHLLGAEVVVVDRHPDRLRLSREVGADVALDNTNEAAWSQLTELAPFDVCLECSGGDVLERIIGRAPKAGLLARPSRLVFVAGRFEASVPFNRAAQCRLECHFTGHFDQGDLDQVLRLARTERLKLRPLVRNVVPIREAVRIYDTLRDDKSKLLGTIFDWTGEHGLG